MQIRKLTSGKKPGRPKGKLVVTSRRRDETPFRRPRTLEDSVPKPKLQRFFISAFIGDPDRYAKKFLGTETRSLRIIGVVSISILREILSLAPNLKNLHLSVRSSSHTAEGRKELDSFLKARRISFTDTSST